MEKTLEKFEINTFQTALLHWFETNKRDLPWRHTTDPYAIWVSEIMLQQTKVDTVIDYYLNFMSRYPTVSALAAAEEQEVLKEWEGLGYYSRARNLKAAAMDVVENYQGIMPSEPKILGKLKGIGPYTQGAISSIAYHLPEPAVDGNVMRVISRVLFIQDNISEARTRKKFEAIIREIISKEDPSSFNQGLMELGALVCTPRSPSCLLCPVQSVCKAFASGKQESLPIKLKAKKQKRLSYTVVVMKDENGSYAIEKRPQTGLLANMWQFPMVESDKSDLTFVAGQINKQYDLNLLIDKKLGEVKHVFTHLIWKLTVYEARAVDIAESEHLKFVALESLADYPFSVSHLKIIDMIKENLAI